MNVTCSFTLQKLYVHLSISNILPTHVKLKRNLDASKRVSGCVSTRLSSKSVMGRIQTHHIDALERICSKNCVQTRLKHERDLLSISPDTRFSAFELDNAFKRIVNWNAVRLLYIFKRVFVRF